ncbi:aminotransferase class V-fold PLP-dependent enzyme [Limosilactobacillus mucosae]|uniref:aminotransferase class V-fold PLP-dependent enzyme n=1 Tax=Limosilactobacillus mucosae TaxID=97478 RepID=UPI0039956481
MDIKRIKQDFPILNQQVNDEPLTYLDSAATAQMPNSVLNAIEYYYRHDHANVHRGTHTLAQRATAAYEQARQKVADFINANQTEEIVFTRSTTESLNWVAQGLTKMINPGDVIVATVMEHHSNLVPWQQLAKRTGAKLRLIGLNDQQELDLDDAKRKIDAKVKIVTIAHASNVLGVINPIKELSSMAHRVGACMIVDGAQSVPHLPVDVQDLDADFYAFSGHKMMAPTGIGVLYGKMEWLKRLEPSQFGGEMIDQVAQQTATFKPVPWRFEAGTPNISGAIALGAAIDYLSQFGMRAIAEHERKLAAYAIPKLLAIEGLTLYGPQDRHTGVLSFNLAGIHPHDAATALDLEGVAVRAGHHCAQPLMDYLGVNATLRASLYLYNDQQDVDRLIDAIKATKEFFENGFEQA